ncbi:hypothetical protein EV363DRAFT_1353197 [Boletus edulis]|uniref:F-box domain-containing protein n=1 Tax=Boletus edulis BED1 TaxID=1328754 RepID=A0AAD4GG31_BOLED|nr:hypothetical protein EV363DRAFT_1353197 [Boletus edulis]KAF8441690.1 hypothetical protein L210DRAFT_3537962 [Boletus edulis BED1]
MMHHSLDIPEILYNIFGHLAPDQGWSWTYDQLPGIRTLAKLARTCRAFKEPALDVLWSELPDFSALMRCVPDVVHSKKQYVRLLTWCMTVFTELSPL